MKKILGILGITLIMAVSFFNMSSVVDANQNVDLASIIQSASADSEDGYVTYNQKVESHTYNEFTYYHHGLPCEYSAKYALTECYGTGLKECSPGEELTEVSDSCGGGGY